MDTTTRTILFVEDDEDDFYLFKEALEMTSPSCNIIWKKNGQEAFGYITESIKTGDYPDLVILDMNMPVMNGKETLAALKNEDLLKNLHLIVLSTSSHPSDLLYCTHFGVSLYVKPYSISDMRRLLKNLVSACPNLLV